MLLNKAPHPNAARVFVNWFLGSDGLTAYSKAMDAPSLRLDVPIDHLPAEAAMRPDGKYWPSYHEQNAVLPPALESLLKELFSR
jgi:ABC-type Fe3+ transport system substrate-binding protein